MRVGIVGCGLIGRRRADVARQSASNELVVVADVDKGRAGSLAREIGCLATTDWREVVARDDIEAIVVSTPNKYLMPVTVAALEHGKHVLVEKPMARNLAEAEQVLRVWKAENGGRKMEGGGWKSDVRLPSSIFHLPIVLAVGFNHRHHPAIWRAHELCNQGTIGPLMFIRAVYGHGGRPGYDKEWRANPALAGGGELLDQGVHIVDLCRWFLGDFAEVFGFTPTYFWGTDRAGEQGSKGARESSPLHLCTSAPLHRKHPLTPSPPHPCSSAPLLPSTSAQVEDNAFALLRTADGRVAQFHTSWTQWKNCFIFEVFGRDGYVHVDGLGGSYGPERLEVGRRKTEGGAPEIEVLDFPGPDLSWQAEWQEFTSAVREGRQPLANGEDGLQAMRLIAAVYESARTGQVVRLDDGGQKAEDGIWKE